MHISVVFSWDLPPWCISFLAMPQEFGSSHIQLRRASARQPNGAPRDHVPLASSSCKCKPIRCKLELHLCTVVSTTGWPLSGYASNWIRGADTIACTTPWLHSFTLYCAYSLIHSHTCTLCVSLYKCLCVCACVFWEVKLVQFSERGRYRSREPRGLRGPRVRSSAHKQEAVPGRT